jgi:16S rRNA (guanine(966)-N(2))-methyltransferase RsmD
VRIISGSLKGKSLVRLSGDEIRPTPDRVREAVFSILISRLGSLAGLRVLDLYAGSGAMAIEALSRGAASALLVDRSKESLRVIEANIRACRLSERIEAVHGDALELLPRLSLRPGFELIFLDPPYGQGLIERTLQGLVEFDRLARTGVVCAETGRSEIVPDRCGDLVRIDFRKYGSTAIHFYAYADREAATP